ncbi:MAG TPA: hypothetical protein VGD67_28235 [Pseudonocardiaceae bacterium]
MRTNTILLVVLLGLSTVLLAPPAEAHHPTGWYLASMRSLPQTEQYCVEDRYTSAAHSYVLNEVRNTLIVENTAWNWDLKRGGKVDFRTVYTPCRDLNSGTVPTRNEVEIEYHVEDTITTAPAACGGTSCAAPAGPSWAGPLGRTEYTWYNVWLRGSLIKAGGDTRRHVVNHETGHVLGLRDGDGSCPSSIMHPSYYGCPGNGNPAWPTALDHETVNRLIDGV